MGQFGSDLDLQRKVKKHPERYHIEKGEDGIIYTYINAYDILLFVLLLIEKVREK